MRPIRNSAKAVIMRDGHLLTLRCADADGIFYQLPGGGQQNGETLVDALKRECREEISSDVGVGDLLFIREYIGGKQGPDWHQVEFMFVCTLPDSAECINGPEPDTAQLGVEWLPIEQLNQFRLYPNAIISLLMDGEVSSLPVYLGDVD